MKHCKVCGTDKPLSEFHRRGEIHQSMCKPCRKAYDAAYWQKKATEYMPRKEAARHAYVAWLTSLKEGRSCVDCEVSYHPAAMQWDHLPSVEKLFNVADAGRKRYARAKVLAEIEKCELVCANCHAVRTYNRRA